MIDSSVSFNRFLGEYRIAKSAFQLRVQGVPLIVLLCAGFDQREIAALSHWNPAAADLFFKGLFDLVVSGGDCDWSSVTSSLPRQWVDCAEALDEQASLLMAQKCSFASYRTACVKALNFLKLEQPIQEWIIQVSNRIYRLQVIKDFLVNHRSGIRKVFGVKTDNPFELYGSQPELMQCYSQSFSRSNQSDSELIAKITEHNFQAVLDVGGGSGSTLAKILRSGCGQSAKGTLYDFKGSNDVLGDIRSSTLSDLVGRVALIEGDFLDADKSLSPLTSSDRFDCIVLGWILHDWPDNTCRKILAKTVRHLSPNGRILVFENIKERTGADLDSLMMFLMMKGKERTKEEYQKIYATVGLTIESIFRPTDMARNLMVLRRG